MQKVCRTLFSLACGCYPDLGRGSFVLSKPTITAYQLQPTTHNAYRLRTRRFPDPIPRRIIETDLIWLCSISTIKKRKEAARVAAIRKLSVAPDKACRSTSIIGQFDELCTPHLLFFSKRLPRYSGILLWVVSPAPGVM